MLNTNNIIEAGSLKIISSALPVLKGGEYVLHVKQTVTLKNNSTESFENSDTKFTVIAPRFSFVDEVRSVYPPTGEGNYTASLPNVTLCRKTLPWERTFNNNPEAPWLALLLFDEDELKDNTISLQTVLLKQIVKPGAGIKSPVLGITDQEAEADSNGYKVIDVPCALLNDVIPYKEELPYLAHARQVDTSDKEVAAIDPTGWVSVVVGNRLPAPGKKNFVFLVSLDGQAANIEKATLERAGSSEKVRLVVLHSWDFTCKGLDFAESLRNIDETAGPLKINAPASVSDSIRNIFEYGYTALNHQLRTGGNTISWYRGPLVPVQIMKPRTPTNCNDADKSLLFDEETTMLDISYASAWQLGRVLALQSSGYVEEITNWKKGYLRNGRLAKARKLLDTKFVGKFSFEEEQQANGENNGADNKKLLMNDVAHKVETDDLLNCLMAELWQQKSNING